MTLDELRAILRPRGGTTPPKGRFIDQPVLYKYPRGLRQYHFRIEWSVSHALLGSSRPRYHDLALTVANCTPKAPCGEEIICFYCKVLAGLAEAEAMTERIGERLNRSLVSAVTIILAVVPTDEPERLKRIVRDFPDQFAKICERWPGSRWHGRLELDLLPSHRTEDLGAYARKTLKAMGWQDDQDWVLVHLHLVLRHPRVARRDVAGAFSGLYPHFRQVQVKPLKSNQTDEVALSRFALYMRKYVPPIFALSGRKSSTRRPRHPDVIRDYIRLQRRFRKKRLLVSGSVPSK